MSTSEALVATNGQVPTQTGSAWDSLTPRYKKFLETYLNNGFIGWKAARDVPYSGDEYALAATASKLLRNPSIRAAMNERLMESAMSANEVLSRITEIASFDPTDYMDDDGNIDIKALRKAKKGHLVKKIKTKRTKKVVAVSTSKIETRSDRFDDRSDEDDITEVVETSVINEDIDVETYDGHGALRDLLRVHGLAGGAPQITVSLTLAQIKGMTDEDIERTIAKFEHTVTGR